MAVQTLDEVIAGLQLSAEEKKLLDNTLSKNPALKDGWLRQDDYSRKQTDLRTKETAAEAKMAEAEAERVKQDAWADRTIPVWESLVAKGIVNDDGEELWTAKQADYDRQLAEARAAAVAGGDMKQEDVERIVADIVKNAGGATKVEVDALMATEMKKVAAAEFKTSWTEKENDFNTKTIPFVAGFSSASAVVAARYERETGERWTADKQKEMLEMMATKKNFDPFTVEDDLLKPHRDKKATDAEVERRVQEKMKAQRAEQGGSDDDIPQNKPKGALQQMLEESATKTTGNKDEDFMSLISSKAREAGSQLRDQGKVGTS